MTSQFAEYKDLYIQTSREYLQELNTALLKLEKNPADTPAIEDIFRSAHSLKSQSAAMEFNSTALLCHTIEDVFYEVKENRLKVDTKLADLLFKSFDNLTKSIDQIEKKGTEFTLDDITQDLKKLTGVKTDGVGKSIRSTPTTPPDGTTKTSSKTISVKVNLLDDLMNLTEELMVLQLSIKQKAPEYYQSSQKILSNLQYKIMQARAIKVGLVFDHFPRAVRDLAKSENKDIELKILGQDLELDKTIVDRLDEPLIHIIRNSVSHGIDKKGTITISATSEKDYAVISIADDGQGINWEKLATMSGLDIKTVTPNKLKDLLFNGVSTAKQVTEISGRGVGMKVVKKMINDFGGEIEVDSVPQKGTKISLKLPLTLAVVKAIMVNIEQQYYAIPSLQVDRIINLKTKDVIETADTQVFILDETQIPIIGLKNTKKIQNDQTIVVIYVNTERVGLIVDSVTQTEDIVVKDLPVDLKNLKLFSGTTITATGQPALVINTHGLVK